MNSQIKTLERTRAKTGFGPGLAARKAAVPHWITSRLVGPGALYNVGNVTALLAGPLLQFFEGWGQITLQEAVYQHLLGSPEAAWLTSAMILFIVAGEIYHRAYQPDQSAMTQMIQRADFIAGVAAVLLTVALFLIGDATLALMAGVLLAGGKLGNALLPALNLANAVRIDSGLRIAAVISRAPSIGTLAWAVTVGVQTGDPVVLPVVMIICFLLWLWADLLLMRRG